MFVSRKVVSGKSLSKLSCVCLSLGKLVNGKHFTVNGNGKHFPVNGNTFRSTWFCFQESVFPFDCVCFPESGFRETTFQTFLCLFAIRKVGQRKTLSSQRKIWLGFQESVFLKNLGGKHFPEVVKNLKMSYYLLIISNLAWFPGKCFPEKFGRKTLSGSCEKFKNVILFANYIKFGP